MNKIEMLQELLYETAQYSRGMNKFMLDDVLINKLVAEVYSYVDDVVSYSNNNERKKLIDKMVIGSLRQVTKRITDQNDYIAMMRGFHVV